MTPDRARPADGEEDTRAGFDRLSDLPAAARATELARIAVSAPDRARRIERWLAADARADSFLEHSPLHGVLSRPTGAVGTGDAIGPYDLGRELGRGGMGVVYEACARSSGRRVALKLLHPGLAGEAEVRRFLQEAEVLRRLDHPGTASFLDAGVATTDRGLQPYLAMELVAGRPLAQHAAGLRRDERLRLVIEMCEAIDHAHRRGIVHRDLKPANVLVDATGRVKVLDFGIARILDAGGESHATLTEPGQVLGTLAYTSPEQLDPARGPVDARSDVWSLGVITYELVSGARPFELDGTTLAAAARIVAEREPVPLARRDRSCAGPLATVVHAAIAREPAERYKSAAAFADDLRRFLAGQPIQARRATPLRQLSKFARRNRAFSAVLAAGVLAGVGGLVSSLRSAASERGQRELAEQRAQALEFELYRHSIGEIRRAILDGAPAHARELLAALPPGPAGFEARHLDEVLSRPERSLVAARATIYRLSVDARGTTLVAASADSSLKVHDLATATVRHDLDAGGQPRRTAIAPDGRSVFALAWNAQQNRMCASLFEDGALTLRSLHDAPAMGWADLAFAPAGNCVFWGWSDGILRAIELPGGRTRFATKVHSSDLRCLAVEPGGAWLLSSGHGSDTSIVQVDAADGTLMRRLEHGTDPVAEILFLGKGARFAVRSAGGHLVVRDGPDADAPRTLAAGEFVQCVAASADGNVLHAGTDGGRILSYDTRTGNLLHAHDVSSGVDELERLEQDGALAAATRDGRVLVIDLFTWQVRTVLATPRAGAGKVTQLLALPGRQELAAGYLGGALVLLRTDARRYTTLRSHSRYVYDVAFLDGGRLLLSAGWDGKLCVHSGDGLELRATLTLPGPALAMEPIDERRVLLAIKDGPLLAIDVEDGRELWRATNGGWPHAGAAIAVTNDGAAAFVLDVGRSQLRRHDARDGRTLEQIGVRQDASALAYSPTGAFLAEGGRGELLLHDPTTLAVRQSLPLAGRAIDLAFTPDGRTLAAATDEGRIEVFAVDSARRVADILASGTPLRALAFDPSGRRLATGSDDGAVVLWDTHTWSRLLELDAHEPSEPEPAYHYVHDLAFHPDATALVSASGDHTVRVWSATRAIATTRSSR